MSTPMLVVCENESFLVKQGMDNIFWWITTVRGGGLFGKAKLVLFVVLFLDIPLLLFVFFVVVFFFFFFFLRWR